MNQMPHRFTDLNLLAKSVTDEATGQAELPPRHGNGTNPGAVALGRLGARKGGKARAKKLSAQKRKAIAQSAADARWFKFKLLRRQQQLTEAIAAANARRQCPSKLDLPEPVARSLEVRLDEINRLLCELYP